MAIKDWTGNGLKLTDDPTYKELIEIQAWFKAGDLDQLEFASQVVDGFPHERDSCYGAPWIGYAVGSGCLKSVNWMIQKGVELSGMDNYGDTSFSTCIDEGGKEKYQILDALIKSGADVNERGINGWTPLHLAAIRDDEKSMHMLLSAGADRTITTEIDDNATAEEEARKLGHMRSANFIASFKL